MTYLLTRISLYYYKSRYKFLQTTDAIFISQYIPSHLIIYVCSNLPLTETKVSSIESTWNREHKLYCWCRRCLHKARENTITIKLENPMWQSVRPNLKTYWIHTLKKAKRTYCLELSPKAASNFLRALFKSSQPDIVPLIKVFRKKERIIL